MLRLFLPAPCLILGFLFSACIGSQETSVQIETPAPNRFVFEDLVRNLNEPMELDFLPDGRILFIERRGILKMYDPASSITQVVGQLDVHYINENGLLGMALDPDFVLNQWIYFFYTDPVRKTYQQLSRFDFRNDSLIVDSEKKLLDFYVDVEHCCHFGGCIAFGPDGNLFISSGDNVGGKDYAPIDERPGRHLHDSQRSSGNSNDLRGSILRITPEADGTYSIPQGNLFAPGSPDTRPEIYVMGARNPLKITVDQATGWLYWGDVGPNPGHKYPEWGPSSYEEINQAQQAGNYGWPYFLADNKAFRDLDFETNVAGAFFDPKQVINNSPNNSGIQELPPAQKALIWYPNTASDSFPLTGTGGGTICAGPVYHYQADLSPDQWPRYFDDKLIIYEWMRSWVLAVELDAQGRYVGMEPIFEGDPFKKPIDIEFGPDGAMYVLDYGSNWYAHNPDARLTRVRYQDGNRPPIAEINASATAGASPLTVDFSAENSRDPDPDDQLHFEWFISGVDFTASGPTCAYTFEEVGEYLVVLRATDPSGAWKEVQEHILVGNAPPAIQFSVQQNQSFYSSKRSIPYAVKVSDKEDGTLSEGEIAKQAIQLSLQTLPFSSNVRKIQEASSQHAHNLAHLHGKNLLETSDCLACHAMAQESVGPSLMEISNRYLEEQKALPQLSNKVLEGGTGVWGNKIMSAHPQHTLPEATAMVAYILSLAQPPKHGQSLTPVGTLTPPNNHTDLMILQASYTDQGANGIAPIESRTQQIFRPNIIPAIHFDDSYRVMPKSYDDSGKLYAEVALNGCYVGFQDIDLTDIEKIRIKMRSNANFIQVDVHQTAQDGPLIGRKREELEEKEDKWAPYVEEDWFMLDVQLDSTARNSRGDLYFVFYSDKEESDYIYFDICQLHSFEFVMN
ncbi:MAG: PQQ-dependent sugar dehydrogenase [Bacteroidota bacterium]